MRVTQSDSVPRVGVCFPAGRNEEFSPKYFGQHNHIRVANRWDHLNKKGTLFSQFSNSRDLLQLLSTDCWIRRGISRLSYKQGWCRAVDSPRQSGDS